MKRRKGWLAAGLVLLLAGCAAEPFGGELAAGADLPQKEATQTESVLPVVIQQDAPNADAPLVNLRAYKDIGEVDFEVEALYMTLYPTYDEDGDLITREEFKKHQSRGKDFNPTLNAHLWQGNPNDLENQEDRFGFDDSLYNATIRVRGNYSRGAPVKSFKVKMINAGDSLFSADSLNLNKHIYDDTRTNNKMAMDLMQMIPSGMVSFETKFVQLHFNDVQTDGSESGFTDQGLYVWIEQPNRDFLVNHGLDPHGSLYKPNVFEFSTQYPALVSEDDPNYDAAAYAEIIKPMANPDHDKLMEMLTAVNDYGRSYEEVFATYFDEENYLTWMAVNVLFGNEDTLTHNMMMYSPSNSSKWYFFPWDYDEAMAYNEVESWGNRFFQQFGIHYFWSIPLHQRYFRIEGNAEKLLAKIDELLETVFTKENFDRLTEGYLRVLDEFMPRDPDLGMTLGLYEDEQRNLWKGYEPSLPAQEVVRQIYTAQARQRYQAVLNNRERYVRTLEYPSPASVLIPEKVEDGWRFRWDASFDHQRDRIHYELILSADYTQKKEGDSWSGYEQTGIFYHEDDLTVTSVTLPELPKGPIYYRVLVHDEQGHVQYPRNYCFVPFSQIPWKNARQGGVVGDAPPDEIFVDEEESAFYFGIGYFYHEG